MKPTNRNRLILYGCTVLVFVAAMYMGWHWVRQVPGIPDVSSSGKGTDLLQEKPPAPEKAAQAVRIAVIGPQTGLPPGMSPFLSNAVHFAVKRINSQGGLLGRPVELLELDNSNSAVGSLLAAQEAVRHGVSAVIGGWYSSNAIAAARALQPARIPMIATGATNPEVTKVGDYIFRVNYVDTFQGAAMAEFAYNSLKARKAAVLVDIGNAYSPYLGDVFSEQFRQFGGEIRWRGEFLGDSPEKFQVIKKLQEVETDVVYLPAYEYESAQLIKKAREAGISTLFLGADGWSAQMVTYGGEAVKGSFCTKGWYPHGEQLKGLQGEYDAWVAENGPMDRDIVALSIDACWVLFSAVQAAGSSDPDKIRAALSETKDFRGLTGSYTFDGNGDPVKPLQILQFTGENLELVKTIQPKKVKLGVIFAKTGDAAPTNGMAFEAARFAAAEINHQGGLLGHLIQLLEYDNQSTALGSREAAQKAVNDHVAAVVGASWSSHSSAMAPVLQNAGIPMIAPASTNPAVTRYGDCIFRACFTDRLQGQVLAEFALQELGAKNAIVMTNTDNQYAVDLARFFIDAFRKSGRVLEEIDYLQATNDFTPQLEAIVRSEPDVVFIPGYPRDAAIILRQAQQMGISTTFLGGDGWDDIMYDLAPQQALDGHYFAEHWHIDMPSERSKRFVENYSRTHEQFRTGLVALTYDTVYLIADAVKRAKSIEPSDIRRSLTETVGFEGVSGRISYDKSGDPVKSVVILRFENGAAAFHKAIAPKNEP